MRKVDPRILTTLEALSRAPESAQHDASQQEIMEFGRVSGLLPTEPWDQWQEWGSMAALLEKARALPPLSQGRGERGASHDWGDTSSPGSLAGRGPPGDGSGTAPAFPSPLLANAP